MFHLALPVRDIEETTNFYRNILSLEIGRSASNWVDFDFHGCQLTFQESENFQEEAVVTNTEGIPSKHFGAILSYEDWNNEKERLKSLSIPFFTEPRVVFEGKVGEQYSFFIQDPNGYVIEFKGFKSLKDVFRNE